MDETRRAGRPDGGERTPVNAPPRPTDPLIGSTIDGRYLITGTLGEGGMGRVYSATHVLMDKKVAIKVIHAELAHVEDIARRFEREAKSSSRLNDPHCISVTDFGRTSEGTLFLVMELLDGESLNARLKRERPLPVTAALRIAAQMLQGLGHAHSQGVVHRDLKPENIHLTSQDGETDFVKILDFGIAKVVSGEDQSESLTRTGIVFGTPKYLSPEQAVGDKIDRRADLYAVGVMLWEMLTGKPPFQAESAVALLSMHVTKSPPSLASFGRFPRGLQELLDRAMAKNPDDRFATAEEFIGAISALDPYAAPRSRLIEMLFNVERKAKDLPGSRRIARFPLVWRIAAVGVALVVAGLTAVMIMSLSSLEGDQKMLEPKVIVPSENVGDVGNKTDEIVELLNRAEARLKEGNASEAADIVKEALGLKPDLPAAHLLLAHAEFQSGARDQAMNDYEKALVADRSLAADIRLRESVREGLKWPSAREKAAWLTAAYGGLDGVKFLADLAGNALTEGAVRRAARKALVDTQHGDAVDWVTSLTADFDELDKCKQRKEVIEQMVATGNKAFLPFLEKQRPAKVKGKHGHTRKINTCIGPAVESAIRALKGEAGRNG